MPQMMPLWWTMIFSLMISLLLMIIIFLYFLHLPKLTHSFKKLPSHYFSWTWLW